MWNVPNRTSHRENSEPKLVLPPSSGSVWCQRWKTGVASTYFKGPSVQLRLAWTKAAVVVSNATRNSSTAGETPRNSMTAGTRNGPSHRLTGGNRYATFQSTSLAEWWIAWKRQNLAP